MSELDYPTYPKSCPFCHGKGLTTIVDGKAMREARQNADVSLENMADGLVISKAYLDELERGVREWEPGHLARRYVELLK